MFRIVNVGNSLPISFPCDPSAEFQQGQVAQLQVIGSIVAASVSNGNSPIGIIDDMRSKAFTNISWNEVIIVPVNNPVAGPNNTLVTPVDLQQPLKQPNILPKSFRSTVNVILNPINGIITFVAGTQLNFDLSGSGTPNAIRAVVSYTYYIPNIPGEDSTAGSGRMTIWYGRMFFQTDQYETNQNYPLNRNLFVSEYGLLTTRQPSPYHPAVGIVTAPPKSMSPLLEVFWF